MNYRSAFLNSETIMVVHSPELAERIASDIEANLMPANSWKVVLDNQGKLAWLTSADGAPKPMPMYRDPQTSLWQRIKSGLIALLPLEKYY